MSQPRAFTGRAACSLWCGYRIVYSAIPDTELHPLPGPERYAMQHCLTSSGAGYVTYTITAHHNAALSLLPVSVYPAQAMHPVMPHRFRIARHTPFAPPDGLHIYHSSFYLILWQPCGCICWHSRIPPGVIPHSSLFTFHLSLITYHFPRLHAPSELSICTAATVNSLPMAGLFYLSFALK